MKLINRYIPCSTAVSFEGIAELDEILDLLFDSKCKYRSHETWGKKETRHLVTNCSNMKNVIIEIGNPFQLEYSSQFETQRTNMDLPMISIIRWSEFKSKFIVPREGQSYFSIDFFNKKITRKEWKSDGEDLLRMEFGNIFIRSEDAKEVLDKYRG